MALSELKKEEVGLIVSDWNMPEMTGLELLNAVRSDGKLKGIPFIMVTAEGQKENIVEAIKAGVSNYIVKPFAPDTLKEKLEAVLGESKGRQREREGEERCMIRNWSRDLSRIPGR